MKRLFLMVIAMLSMTLTFAENENAVEMTTSEAYDMKVNIRKLGEVLGLTYDQMESVSDIHRTFCGEMLIASQAHKEERDVLVEKAVKKDLKYMNYILNSEQFKKYHLLLSTTLNNRGIVCNNR